MTQARRARAAAFVISAVLLFVGSTSPVFAQSNYRLVQVGSLKPVYDINDEGMAVGFYVFGDPSGNRGFRWTESTGDVPLVANPADINKFPYYDSGPVLGINNGGTVVGQGRESGASPFSATVLSPAGVLTFLPPAPLEQPPVLARQVNSSGAVVGLGRLNGQVGFYWTAATGTQMMSTDPFASFYASDAFDINDSGVVVGRCVGSECPFDSGYLWTPTGHFVIPKVAGFPNAAHEAWAINNLNQVVGRYGTTGVFFWSAATGTIDLNAPAGSPTNLDINDRGQIIATITTPGVSTAYLYRNGTWTDLNTFRQPGETFAIDQARAINNDGWIAGQGNGPLQAGFILIPPTVDMTANGVDGPLSIGPGVPLQFSLKFDGGNGHLLNPAEIYMGLATSFGVFWLTPNGFSLTPSRLYTGPLPSFPASPLLTFPGGVLPPGTYVWITIVDQDSNGVINGHFLDYAIATITP